MTLTCPVCTSPSNVVPTAAASSTKEAPTAPNSTAQKFRRPCSPPATKLSPARPFSSSALFRTTSYLPLPPAPTPPLSRQPPNQGKSKLQFPRKFARPLLLPPRPRQTALTRRPKRLRHPRHSKIDLPNAQSRQLRDRRHLAPHSRRAQASHPPSPSAVGPFTRSLTAGRSRKVSAFNK